MNTYFDLFLRAFISRGPIMGKQLSFLHYGRPLRPVRWGGRMRGVAGSIFTGTNRPNESGSGTTGFGDASVIEGPGPLHGTDDDHDTTSIGGGAAEDTNGAITHDNGS